MSHQQQGFEPLALSFELVSGFAADDSNHRSDKTCLNWQERIPIYSHFLIFLACTWQVIYNEEHN